MNPRQERLLSVGVAPAAPWPAEAGRTQKSAKHSAAPPHDLAPGDWVVSELHRVREDGRLDPEPAFQGTVAELRPPSFGLPAGVAVVRLDEDGQLAEVDVTALVHEDGRPASPIPFWREPEWEVPPAPRTVVNAVRHEIRTGEDAEDRLRWARLLMRCRREDHALAKTLGFLRRRGAALQPHGEGCRLDSGTMDRAAYAAARERELVPRGQALAAVLNGLGDP